MENFENYISCLDIFGGPKKRSFREIRNMRILIRIGDFFVLLLLV
jgi:hypothetical protein